MALSTLADAVLGSLTLLQITQGTYSSNASVINGRQSGSPTIQERIGGFATPRWSGVSNDVEAAANTLSMTAGVTVSSGTITVPFNKRATVAGHLGATTNHFRATGTDGLVVPTSFEARAGNEPATVGVDCHFLSTDGTTDPVTLADDQTLASQSYNEMHGFGSAVLNTNTIVNCIGAKINPGLTVNPDGGNNFLTYPQFLPIEDIDPTIELTFASIEDLADFSLAASYTVMTALDVYFRKRSGVGFVATATAAHVKFSFTDGLIVADQIQASDMAPGAVTVTCHGETLTAAIDQAMP